MDQDHQLKEAPIQVCTMIVIMLVFDMPKHSLVFHTVRRTPISQSPIVLPLLLEFHPHQDQVIKLVILQVQIGLSSLVRIGLDLLIILFLLVKYLTHKGMIIDY